MPTIPKISKSREVAISVKFFTREDIWISMELFEQYRRGEVEIGTRINFREHPNRPLKTGIVEATSPLLYLCKL
jgi:hypothetical protein